MITSFNCKETEKLFEGRVSRKVAAGCARVAHRKLAMVDAAVRLADLAIPPGNRLEALRDDREGQHSIRVNDQWRVCFVWDDATGSASAVEIVDYH